MYFLKIDRKLKKMDRNFRNTDNETYIKRIETLD